MIETILIIIVVAIGSFIGGNKLGKAKQKRAFIKSVDDLLLREIEDVQETYYNYDHEHNPSEVLSGEANSPQAPKEAEDESN